MAKGEVVSGGGIGIGGLVFTILLILKLTGNISMGWFGVITSLVWAPIVAIVGILILFAAIYFFALIFTGILVFFESVYYKIKK